jgi:hypothetical protein
MWLTSFIKGFFKPSASRIFIFIVVFIFVSVYDLTLKPFPDSPVITNIGGASQSFLINFLVIPYILSCILPSLAELRKKKIFRHAKIWEFIMHEKPVLEEEKQNLKPATKIQSTYNLDSRGQPQGQAQEPGKVSTSDSMDVLEKSTESPKPQPKKKRASKPTAKPRPKPRKRAKQKPRHSKRKRR